MFDYIIVGAGSAGCVLARRLSEERGTRVLLLESGLPDNKKEIHIPAAFPKLFHTEYDWNYYTEPQKGCAGRKMFWPRGRCLGGSSSINAMIYIRGNRRDYDDWRTGGNEGWGFDDVLPYFKKSEDNQWGASEYHGAGGPLRIEDRRETNILCEQFVEAARGAGIPANKDFNGAETDGCGMYQVTQRAGVRCSTAAGFIKPVLDRPNLTVKTGAHATRILFQGNRATGVAYIHNGRAVEARAEREVILAGGAINSPQILQLSGVGPADPLRRLGISVVADLPGVGENLQDHIACMVAFRVTQPVSINEAETIGNLIKYLFTKRGPLSSNIAEAGAFVRIAEGADRPDLQFLSAAVFFVEHGAVRVPGHGMSVGPVLLAPESHGTVMIRSTDPAAHPAIDPRYYETERDLRLMVEGIKLGREIASQRNLDPYRGEEYLPGRETRTDAEIAKYLRERSETLYHPVGTCKMGNDPMAVVDSHLRVHGLEGLRVADASVMPNIVGGNTNAPTIMIAEKAADLIRAGATDRAAAVRALATAVR